MSAENYSIKTNLDTNFLKLIAIISMFLDHVGSVFFPEYPIFRWIGRMAFPIFCYCMVVGMIYTSDIKKYLGRLLLFAIISQPFYILVFSSENIVENIFNFNIFFTLFFSLLTVWGFKEKKWIIFIGGFLLISFVNFDYSSIGVLIMMVFYLCRNNPVLGALIYSAFFFQMSYFASPDPTNITILGHGFDFMIFTLLDVPLIFLKTNFNIKVPRWFFYWFYPAHLFLIYVIRLMITL